MPPIAHVREKKTKLAMPEAVSVESMQAFRKVSERAKDMAVANAYVEEAEFAEGFVSTNIWEAGQFTTRL
jgi:hypothetical protein